MHFREKCVTLTLVVSCHLSLDRKRQFETNNFLACGVLSLFLFYSNIINSPRIFKFSEFFKGEIGLYQFGEERVRLPFGVLPDTMNVYNVSFE